jgi:hypothetical protein
MELDMVRRRLLHPSCVRVPRPETGELYVHDNLHKKSTSVLHACFSLAFLIMTSLDATLGAAEVGIAIACYLFGILSLQTFIYFKNNIKDPLMLKSLVRF